MKYPKLSCENSRRDKYCKEDKLKVKQLHKQGLNNVQIADKLGMSETTVRVTLNKKALIETREKSRIINKKRYRCDPIYYANLKKNVRINYKIRFENDPEFRKYMREVGRKWYKNNREYVLKYAKKYREKMLKDPVWKKKYNKRRKEYQKKRWKILKNDPVKLKKFNDEAKKRYKATMNDPIKRKKSQKTAKEYVKKHAKEIKKRNKIRWQQLKNNPKAIEKNRKRNKIAVNRYRSNKHE